MSLNKIQEVSEQNNSASAAEQVDIDKNAVDNSYEKKTKQNK